MANTPERFKDRESALCILNNINMILDEVDKKIEAVKGVARFLNFRLDEMESRMGVLETVSVKLIKESRKVSSDKLHKRVSSTTFLNEEDSLEKPSGSESDPEDAFCLGGEKIVKTISEGSPEKPKRKYKKKYPNKKLGRPRKKSLMQQYKEVYNPDKDEIMTGTE